MTAHTPESAPAAHSLPGLTRGELADGCLALAMRYVEPPQHLREAGVQFWRNTRAQVPMTAPQLLAGALLATTADTLARCLDMPEAMEAPRRLCELALELWTTHGMRQHIAASPDFAVRNPAAADLPHAITLLCAAAAGVSEALAEVKAIAAKSHPSRRGDSHV